MIQQLKKIWRLIFNDDYEYINWYFNNIYPKNKSHIVKENSQLVGTIYQNKYNFSLNDKKLFTADYLVGVAVIPEKQNQGIMRKMITDVINERKENGDEVIFLTPIDKAIYERFDFNYISSLLEYECEFSHFSSFKREYTIISPTISDMENSIYEKLENFYLSVSNQFNLKVNRDKISYKLLLSELNCEEGELYIAYDSLKEIKGYILLHKNKDIFIREILIEDEIALESLLATIYTFKNYYNKVKIITPQNLELENFIKSDFSLVKKVKNKLQARILDIEPLLLKLSKRLNNFEDLIIEISDNIIQENNDIFKISQNKVERNKSLTSDLTISIFDITPLIFGFKDFNYLLEKKSLNNKNKKNIIYKFFKKGYNFFNQDF